MYRSVLKRIPLKRLFLAAVIIGAAVVFYRTARRLTILHKANAQVTAAPFTAELHTYTYSKNPSGELLAKKIIARRSDGTTCTIASAGPVERGWNSRKIQYMDGRYTGVVDLISSVFKSSINSNELAGLKSRLTNPPANCVFDPSFRMSGREQLFGRSLVKIVTDTPQRVYTMLLEPAFGCERLQETVETKQSDGSLQLLSRTYIVGLKVGEPDQSLFDEPVAFQQSFSVQDLEKRFGDALRERNLIPARPAK